MAIKTIQIADKTTLDAINTLLTNGTYGLSALNKDLDSLISSLGNSTYGLSAIRSLLANSTYGLSALKTAISGVSSGSGGGGFSSISITGPRTTCTVCGSPSQYYGYPYTTNNVDTTVTGKGFVVNTSGVNLSITVNGSLTISVGKGNYCAIPFSTKVTLHNDDYESSTFTSTTTPATKQYSCLVVLY